ncbi:acetyl-CoA carboxylase biotin carboxyl carrier protein subunit [candidate division KSB3 bacterium]|nr:MAG: acetyl-CoA carboxylase biotin carboxyl carrier protein subunit [candidate division KSB3 bacterium]
MKKRMRITVNGQTYEVEAEILDDDQAPASAFFSPVGGVSVGAAPSTAPVPKASVAARTSSAPGGVPSPIAGKVVSIARPTGSTVAAGEVLLVLEAMKMNTEVTAPAAGTVSEVKVSPGESVEEGQILMTLT